MNQRFEFEFLIAHKLNSNLYSLFVDLLLCFSSSSSYHYYYYYFLLLFFFLVLVQTSTLAFTSSISPTGNVSDVPKVQQSSSCIVPTSTAKMTTTGEMFFFFTPCTEDGAALGRALAFNSCGPNSTPGGDLPEG